MTFKMKVTCPFCEEVHEFHDSLVKDIPKPVDGDFATCMDCGEIAIYECDGTALRKPTDDEKARMDRDPRCRASRAAWQNMKDVLRGYTQ